MNALKPLLVVAVLGGIAYGVYTKLNSGPETPPAGLADGWDAPPDIQIGESAPPKHNHRSHSPDGPSRESSAGSAEQPWLAGDAGATVNADAPAAEPWSPNPSPRKDRATGHTHEGHSTATDHGDEIASAPLDPPFGRDGYRNSPKQPSAGAGGANEDGQPPLPGGPVRGGKPAFDPTSAESAAQFERGLETARRAAESGQLIEAHRQLSTWYDNPSLSSTELQQLTELLDQVAGTVIYSTQNLLEPAYTVGAGERLEDVAARFGVNWQLLAKINGIDDPHSLQPGEQIKVLRGPFSAVISLDRRQLTLYLDGLYAGRFALGVGRDYPPVEGQYTVTEKIANPTYHGAERSIDADDPANPLGERWIGLNGNIGLHGSVDANYVGASDLPGSISFSGRDIEDLYDILGMNSSVVIQR